MFTCVKDKDGEKNVLKIFDLENDMKQDKFPMNGESAIIHPRKKWLAIRGGSTLQVFDAAEKKKVCSRKLENEEISFWTWVGDNQNLIAVVTKNSVFHWDVDQNNFTQVFEISAKLQGSQIISYKASEDRKWFVLTGISKSTDSSASAAVVGNTQLFSVDKNTSQPLAAHVACFCEVLKENETRPRSVFTFVDTSSSSAKLFVMELDKSKSDAFKLPPMSVDIDSDDFPVSLLFIKKQQCLFLISKKGFCLVFDVLTGKMILKKRVTADGQTIFASVTTKNDKILGITVKSGTLLRLQLDETKLVQYLLRTPENASLAISFTKRLGLDTGNAGVSADLYKKAFNSALLSSPTEAASLAATSPNDILRTRDTLNKLKGSNVAILAYFKTIMTRDKLNSFETVELGKILVLQKKHNMLEKLIKENKVTLSEQLGDVLASYTSSEAIGISDVTLSETEKKEILRLSVGCYMKLSTSPTAGASESVKRKVVEGLVEMNEISKIVTYCNKVGYTPAYKLILENIIKKNMKQGEVFAKELISKPETRSLIEAKDVVSLFLEQDKTKGLELATKFLIEYLKEDKPEDETLQTLLLEINIRHKQINIVEAIISNDMLHHYNKNKIANLLEENKYYKRSLSLYTDLVSVKRVLKLLLLEIYNTTDKDSPDKVTREEKEVEEFVLNFCSKRSKDNLFDILNEIYQIYLTSLNSKSLKLVISICYENVDKLETDDILNFLYSLSVEENISILESIFLFCSQVLNTEFKTKQSILKLIETGCKLSQFDVVIKVIKENELIPAIKEKLKNFLLLENENIKDPRPFIHLCDRLNLISELTSYLVTNKKLNYLEIYLMKVNVKSSTQVIMKLLDYNTTELNDFVKKLLKEERIQREGIDYEILVKDLAKRNKLSFIKDSIQNIITNKLEGFDSKVINNTLCKIYILESDMEGGEVEKDKVVHFLKNNEYYDSEEIGQFCETVDISLSLICYEKSKNFDKLIKMCFMNEKYDHLLEYCLKEESIELWTKIFTLSDKDQVSQFLDVSVSSSSLSKIQTTLAQLSILIKALLTVQSHNHLLILCEYLLLSQNSTLSEKEKKSTLLQNLLLLSAIKIKTKNHKILEYLSDERLNNYEISYVSSQLLENDLKKECIELYKKHGKFKEAIEIMLTLESVQDLETTVQNWLSHMKSDDSTGDLTVEEERKVLSVIGKHALEKGLLDVATKYLTKALNPDDYIEVIKKGIELKKYSPAFIEYLYMCRNKIKDNSIDSTLAYVLAMSLEKDKLEEFLQQPNLVQISRVAERLLTSYKQRSAEEDSKDVEVLFDCVVLLFKKENNYTKLSEIYLEKKDYAKAIEISNKANKIDLWLDIIKLTLSENEMDYCKKVCFNLIDNKQQFIFIYNLYFKNNKILDLIKLLEESISKKESLTNLVYVNLCLLYIEYGEFLKLEVDLKEFLLKYKSKFANKDTLVKIVKKLEEMFMINEIYQVYDIMKESDVFEIEYMFSLILKYSCDKEDTDSQFVSLIKNQTSKNYIKNIEVYYKILRHYIKYIPMTLSKILITMEEAFIVAKGRGIEIGFDYKYIINLANEADIIHVLKEYFIHLRDTLNKNIETVNEIYNEILLEEEEYNLLKDSIKKFTNFNLSELALKLENHDIKKFRILSTEIYFKTGNFNKVLEICETNKQYNQIIFYLKQSQDKDLIAEYLLKFSTIKDKTPAEQERNKRYFVILINLCYEYIDSYRVLEISWKNSWFDVSMPFVIQSMKQSSEKIRSLEAKVDKLMEEKKRAGEKSEKKATSLLSNGSNLLMG